MFSDPLAVDRHAAFASRYEGRGMPRRSIRPPLFFAGMQCRSKCYGGICQTEKPARYWRVAACSLIPLQLTDKQRLPPGMKVEVWEAVL